MYVNVSILGHSARCRSCLDLRRQAGPTENGCPKIGGFAVNVATPKALEQGKLAKF